MLQIINHKRKQKKKASMSPIPPLVRRIPNSIMYNLVEACRVAKKQGGEDFLDEACRRRYGETEEVMSEIWSEEDEDEEEGNASFLIVRLIDNGTSYPWLVAHRGSCEIIRAPLFVPVVTSNEGEATVLCVFLRDHAYRGDNGIKRKFYLKFATSVEADSFKFTHNRMIEVYQSRGKEGVQEGMSEIEDKKRSRNSSISNCKDDGGQDFGDQEEELKSPPHKKRKVEKEAQKEKNEERSATKNEAAKKTILLKNDESIFSALDDAFECTQDPFSSDY